MYINEAGESVPQGPDAFSPSSQFKGSADTRGTFENRVIVNLSTDRDALAPPVVRKGVRSYVQNDDTEWVWNGTTWVWAAKPPAQGIIPLTAFANGVVSSAIPITFPAGRFASAPNVMVSSSRVRLNVSVQDITTSGANVFVANWSGADQATGGQVTWVALG